MIIVLDTNIIVSSLLQPLGKPAAVLRLLLTGQVVLAYDHRILAEYREVLRRPKFPFTAEQIDTLLDFFEKDGIPVIGSPLANPLPDPDDEPFLEIAIGGNVDALVTGNKRHFPAPATGAVRVLSPTEFLQYFHRMAQ